MKAGFRQSMAWLHTWVGLVPGWVLFFVFLTGTAGYFDEEISRWMRPELPLRPLPAAVEAGQGVARAQDFLAREAAGAERWTITIPERRYDHAWRIAWTGVPGRTDGATLFDAQAGAPIAEPPRVKPRPTGGGVALYRLHYSLRYLPDTAGLFIVGLCSMLMLLAIVTGVITHRRIFADFFTYRPGKGQRSWLDLHNVISVAGLPFFVMITYSGLVFFMHHYLPAGMHAVYGSEQSWVREGHGFFRPGHFNPLNPRGNGRFDPARAEAPVDRTGRRDGLPEMTQGAPSATPLADLRGPLQQAQTVWGRHGVAVIEVRRPGFEDAEVAVFRAQRMLSGHADRLTFDGASGTRIGNPATVRSSSPWTVQDTLTDLHEGLFAGPALRWLYFVSGLLGCAMIASGLVLWTAKRRREQQKRLSDGRSTTFGFRLVEALNIGTIAGLCTAVAIYFWANRLLPADLPGRGNREFDALFIGWGLLLLHAAWAVSRAGSVRAWRDQWRFAAAAWGLLPVLNALTTQHHLGVTLPAGDWVLAGFDLTALALGAGFAAFASMPRRTVGDGP